MTNEERKRIIDQRNRDEYVRIMKAKARAKQKAKASGGCLLYIALALIVVLAFVVCGCYPEDTGHWPNKPDPDDFHEYTMIVFVILAAFAGAWWYSRRQAVK